MKSDVEFIILTRVEPHERIDVLRRMERVLSGGFKGTRKDKWDYIDLLVVECLKDLKWRNAMK